MNYWLRLPFLGGSHTLPITKDHFEQLAASKKRLLLISSFVENYRVVLDSYRTIETSLHKQSLNQQTLGFSFYKESLDTRVKLNSAYIGYLSAMRYFHDWSDRNLKEVLSHDQVKSFQTFRLNLRDSTPNYRFIEALRNYAQHRELPIEGIKYHHFVENTDDNENTDIVTAITTYISKQKLSKDKKFNKAALADMPDTINIVHCIRTHMNGIWKLYNYFFENYSKVATDSRKIIEESRNRFAKEFDGSLLGLEANSEKNGTIVDAIPLLLNWDDARIEAQKEIGNLNNLHRRYVSGKILKT